MSSIFKTAIFILHNPSVGKIYALEAAGQQYIKTIQGILDYFRQNSLEIIEIFNDLFPNKSLNAKWLENHISKNYTGTKCLCRKLFDGALAKAVLMIQSYLALKGIDDKTNYPKMVSSKEMDYFTALDNFTQSVIESDKQFTELQSDIIRCNKSTQLICGYKRSRDFPLIRNISTGKYYALLSLGTGTKPLANAGKEDFVWATTGEVFTMIKTDAVIFPLSFGEWHEQEFWNKGNPKTAEVLKINGRYELHVAFEMPADEKINTETYLGLDRGLINIATPVVIGADGKLIHAELFDGKNFTSIVREEVKAQREGQKKGKRLFGHKRKNVSKNICHVITNKIVYLAKKYRSQVVLEFLGNLRGPHSKKYQQYSRVAQLLEYKLPLAGLPKPISRGAAWTSQTCHVCGYIHADNRGKGEERDSFKCLQCGHEDNADINAGVNIARKALWKKDSKLPKDKVFEEWQKFCVKIS